jgi:hypothetical protein
MGMIEGDPEYDPWSMQAARMRARYPTRMPDPRALAASQGAVGFADLPGFPEARREATNVYYGEDYNPSSLLQMAVGAVGAPGLVGGVPGLGSGVGRARVAAPAVQTEQSLFDLSQLRQQPNVPQFNLERYEPPRGVPARTQVLADPENIARVNEVVKRGAQQGGMEWYNTEPLRERFIGELGPDKGMAAYQQYLDLVAATSPRSKVAENARNASYYYSLAQQGLPLPQSIRKGGALSVAEPLPSPYGHIAQGLHAQNARNVVQGGGWPVLQNPKPASFSQNLQGNQMPVTIDTHNARLWGMTDTKGRPIDMPEPSQYGFMERLQQEQAAKLGMTPAQYQASAWIGGGEQTGLKSAADPFVKTVEDRVNITAKKLGLTPEEVLRRFMRGELPLLGTAGAAYLGTREKD